MYDYVLQLGFDEETQNYVESIKNILKTNNIQDRERNWLPHITIDLYNCKDENEFISKIDNIIYSINSCNIQFKNLNNFNQETLYIEPYNKDELYNIKKLFDNYLDMYRLEKRKLRIYKPHVTLCTNDDLIPAYEIVTKDFAPFNGKVKYLWVYNQKMDLIKQYILKDNA